MPNAFIENREAWLRMTEIDYIGQFVKAWLAFNAWYRSASAEHQDRKIIDDLKWHPNSVLNKLRPLLTTSSEEAEQFRAEIGLLHHRLQAYEIHSGKGEQKERISMTQVFLKPNPPGVKTDQSHGATFRVERSPNGHLKTEVLSKTAKVIFQLAQPSFDLAGLQADGKFLQKLSVNRRAVLMLLYKEAAPRWIEDLTQYEDPKVGLTPSGKTKATEIVFGAYTFKVWPRGSLCRRR